MSTVLAKLETAKLIELKDELEKTPYPRLKKKLTEIGVPDAWVSGEDKEVIIRTAMQMLEKVGTETPEEVKPEVVTEVVPESVKKENIEEAIKEPVIEEKSKNEEEVVNKEIVEEKPVVEVVETKDETEVEDKKDLTKVEEIEPVKKESPLKNISTEDLLKNLDRIEALIKESQPFQKAQLFAKKKQIEDRLMELGL